MTIGKWQVYLRWRSYRFEFVDERHNGIIKRKFSILLNNSPTQDLILIFFLLRKSRRSFTLQPAVCYKKYIYELKTKKDHNQIITRTL